MISLVGDSADELYVAACDAVLREGARVSPRGLATTEVLGAHLCLTDPRRRLVDLPPARVVNPAFAVAEAVWILSGSDDPWIFLYNRALTRYTDDGRLQGAYGPRMRHWGGRVDQLDRIRRLLADDPDTRQAVIQLYDPDRDTRGHRDVPCTLGYRFYVRRGQLQMHTTMRSQDLWLGFPYDIFAATILQELLAGWLGVELGEYHHHVDSLHLYTTHTDDAARLSPPAHPSPRMPTLRISWDALAPTLTDVITGNPPPDAPQAWTAFAAMLTSYRAWTNGDQAAAILRATAIPGDLGRALERWYEHLTNSSRRVATLGTPQ
jgi:thymidylate synthase